MLEASLTLLEAGSVCLAFRALYRLAALALTRGARPAPERLSRLVSCIHACALAALGALATAQPALLESAWWRGAASALPLGYLAHDADLIWDEPSLWDPWMLAHHFAFAGLVAAGVKKYPGLAARAFLAELSTPLLHAAWAARRSGADHRHPWGTRALGALLFVTFFYFRAYSLAALAVEAYALGEWLPGILMSGLAALNWYWFARLLRHAARACISAPPAARRKHRRI